MKGMSIDPIELGRCDPVRMVIQDLEISRSDLLAVRES